MLLEMKHISWSIPVRKTIDKDTTQMIKVYPHIPLYNDQKEHRKNPGQLRPNLISFDSIPFDITTDFFIVFSFLIKWIKVNLKHIDLKLLL